MPQSAGALVEDRLSQLQEITKRRNQLLQEMYHLMQKRDNLGSVATVEQGNGENLQVFLERFDLQKHPDSGSIASLSDAEIFGDPTAAAHDSGSPFSQTHADVQHVAGGSPQLKAAASPQVVVQHEDSPARLESVEVKAQGTDDEQLRGISQPKGPRSVDENPGYGSDEKRGTKRKRDSAQSSDSSDSDEPRFRSRSRFSGGKQSRSRSVASHSLSPRPEPPQRTPSPRSPISQDAADHHVSIPLLSPEVLDSKEDMHLDETSSDSVSHLLNASPHPPSSRPSPVAEPARRQEYVIAVPPPTPVVSFCFDSDVEGMTVKTATSPVQVKVPDDFIRFKQDYSLPPLSILPAEFQRKNASSRHKKKRDKEKHERGGDKGDGKRDDWTPIGINKWGALLRANPVWKKLSKANKCVSTHEWNVAYQELRLIRTLERVELLKEGSGWSFRQPKKQRSLGGTAKSHWDFLMDEMKWMRTDFREERRWKMALAFNLAHAVMDWHEAASLEERVNRGICVLWRRTRPEQDDVTEEVDNRDDVEIPDMDNERGADSRETNTPANDSDSDDDSDDEGEKDRTDVYDVLAPENVAKDAVETFSSHADPSLSSFKVDLADLRPKTEDEEDLSALQLPESSLQRGTMDIDGEDSSLQRSYGRFQPFSKAEDNGITSNSALRPTSKDPTLASPPSKSKARRDASAYGPLRDHILSLEMDKLVLDLDDVELVKGMSELSTEDHSLANYGAHLPPPDFSSIFPDLTPYGMLDPAHEASGERKKSDKPGRLDKDDPNKRIDDTLYTKLTPMSDFMLQRPTLVGALEPSVHWSGDHWEHMDEPPISVDYESPMSRTGEDNLCSLFEGSKAGSPSSHSTLLPLGSRDMRRRTADILWTAQDDALLKQVADMYPNNWPLIADSFNSSRMSISMDRRTAADCFDRWNTRWGRSEATDDSRSQAASAPTQMTTRYKRAASNAAASQAANINASTGVDAKKRRHSLMHDTIRKAIKKKEAAAKQNATQRKSSAMHDTHGQYNKLPKYTPAELSRIKSEKEIHMREQAQQAQQRQALLQQQSQPQQGQQPPANGAPRPNGLAQQQPQPVPQIRTQVGISQQQRLSNPMALANTRMSPTQLMQAQAQAQAQAQRALAQAQVQAQAQAQAAGGMPASNMNGAHLSPPYAARATSSSPAIPQQASPPHTSATPASGAGSSRPSSTQPHAGMTQAQAVGVQRQNLGYYGIPTLHSAQFATDQQPMDQMQLQSLLRTAAANMSQNGQNGAYQQQQ